ncbi:MAG: hypothetical protein J7L11_09235 [Thermoprotei archaeon]|nr:hypothetical protein [Thermoprotei archaeon]
MKEDNKPSSVAYGCDIVKCPKGGRDTPDDGDPPHPLVPPCTSQYEDAPL